MFGTLICAWILTGFGVDEMFIEVVQPFVNVELTQSHWYVMFLIIGLIYDLIH